MNKNRTLLHGLIITLVFQLTFCLNASSQGYTFSVTNNSYSVLSNPTVVSTTGWEGFNKFDNIPLGFTFRYWNENYTTLSLIADGRISFSDFQGGETIILMTGEISEHKTLISDISYLTEGSAPNRIFKIQVQNAGFTNDASGNAYINFQIWLHESSNKLEVHHGNSGSLSSSLYLMGGPYYGLTNQNADSFYCLKGNSASPSFLLNSTSPQVVNSFPSNGITYVFTPVTGGTTKTLELTSPDGGEKWNVGETHKITWNSSGISSIKIEYSTGGPWVTEANSVDATTGTYDWIIPNSPSNGCKVRISEVSGGIQDESSSPFEIALGTSVEKQVLTEFAVYPNPSGGLVYLNVPLGFDGQVIIMDQTGKEISNKSIPAHHAEQQTLVLSELTAGLYVIMLKNNQNKHMETIKLVITP